MLFPQKPVVYCFNGLNCWANLFKVVNLCAKRLIHMFMFKTKKKPDVDDKTRLMKQ